MIDADELMEQLLTGEEFGPHELLGLEAGVTDSARVESALKERVELLRPMMAVPQFARYVPQCEAILRDARDTLLGGEAVTENEESGEMEEVTEVESPKGELRQEGQAKPSRPSRGALRQQREEEEARQRQQEKRKTFEAKVREKVMSEGKLSSKNFVEACKVGKKVGLSNEDIGEIVKSAQEERYLGMVNGLVSLNTHNGILGRLTEKKIRELCEGAGIPSAQAKTLIAKCLEKNRSARMPKLSDEGQEFRKEAANRLKSLGNTPQAERVLMRLGKTSGCPEKEWTAIVHDLLGSLRLPAELDGAPSTSLPDSAENDYSPPSSPEDGEDDDGYEVIGDDTDEDEEAERRPRKKKKKKKARSRSEPVSSPARSGAPRKKKKRVVVAPASAPLPPRSNAVMFVSIGFGLFGLGALVAVGALVMSGKTPVPPITEATTTIVDSTTVPPKPEMTGESEPDTTSEAEPDETEQTSTESPASTGEASEVTIRKGPVISSAAALEFIGKAIEKQGSERQKNADMVQDLCVLSFARALGVAVWTKHNAEADHWLGEIKKLVFTRDLERSITGIALGKDAPQEPDGEDMIIKIMRRVVYANRSVGMMLNGFAWMDDADAGKPVYFETPLEHVTLLDKQLYEVLKRATMAYSQMLPSHPAFENLRGRTQQDVNSRVESLKNKDYVLDRFLTTTYMQRIVNKQYSSAEWLAQIVKLVDTRAARDMDVKINTMLSKGEDAISPLGQFRAGLVTELELLTILLKKK